MISHCKRVRFFFFYLEQKMIHKNTLTFSFFFSKKKHVDHNLCFAISNFRHFSLLPVEDTTTLWTSWYQSFITATSLYFVQMASILNVDGPFSFDRSECWRAFFSISCTTFVSNYSEWHIRYRRWIIMY